MPVSLNERAGAASGQRVYRVQIQQLTEVVRPSGIAGEDWTALGEPVCMSRADTVADERVTADQRAAWTQTLWGLLYQPNMDPDLVDVTKRRRLLYGGRVFDIQSASMPTLHRTIQLVTTVGEL